MMKAITRTTKAKKRSNRIGILFILPSFIGVIIFVLIPFLDVFRRAFVTAVNAEWVGLTNFKMVFDNTAFQLAAKNTLRFVGVCIPILIISSLLIGVVLSQQRNGSNLIKSLFLMPMAIPVASVVLVWKVIFHNQGLLNGFVSKIGGTPVDWMNSKYAFWVLVGSYIWKNLGYNIVLWMAGLASISESVYEAAKMDGAGSWKIFYAITLPNLRPTLYTITVLAFLNSFKVFREGYLVAGDYPHESMYLLQHLFNNWFRDLAFDKIAAAAVVVTIFIMVLITLLQKAWDNKE